MRIDLNADLGEGVGDDEALLAIVTSANIATGAHAGGGALLTRAVASAARHGVAIGAHPSYRDRVGFGRASHLGVLHRDLSARSHLVGDLVEQIIGVAHEAARHGAPLAHVKAHGSLYNEAVHDPVAAQVVADAVLGAEHVLGHGIALMTQPGGELARVAAGRGMVVIPEGFADRRYLSTGQLVPRSEPRAVHRDTGSMVAQALDLAGGHVTPVDGPRIAVEVRSLCVHGDTPGAVAAAREIRAALEAQGWQVVAHGRDPGGVAPSEVERGAPAAAAGGTPTAAGDRDRILTGPRAGGAGGVGGEPVSIRPFGDRALLVEPSGSGAPDTEWVLRVAARARRQWPQATVVPGLASVVVAFERPSDRPDPRGPEVRDLLSGHGWAGDGTAPLDVGDLVAPRFHTLPTRYDGPDLADVAVMLRLPSAEVVRRHGQATWTVAAIGFSPGFGYLTTPDPLFVGVGRRADPRPRVPRGSVALAAQMCAVYPSATPGGWQLIGSTTVGLFDENAEHPALLRVGDRVTFVEVP